MTQLSDQKRTEILNEIQWKVITLLINSEKCFENISELKGEYFNGKPKYIFSELQQVYLEKGTKLDKSVIASRCSFELPEIDADEKLFHEYVSEIREAYEKETIKNSLKSIDLEGDATSIKHRLFSLVNNLTGDREESFNLSRSIDNIVERIFSGVRPEGISTGIEKLDNLTGGIQIGDFVVLAGRPSMGKSSIAQQVMVKNSYGKSNGTLYYSLEDSTDSVLGRCLANITGILYSRIRFNQLDQGDKLLVSGILPTWKKSPMFVYDTFRDVYSIIGHARKQKIRNPNINLIVVDYVQLVSGDGTRLEITSEASRLLKLLGKDINVAVLCLSQLSRKPEERDNKRPIPSDLRETGTLEQDADLIWFPFRPYQYSKDDIEKDICEHTIAKQRNGPIGTVIGKCFLECFQFT